MIPLRRPVALAVMACAMLPLAAQAELRPAALPSEICLVLSNGPFDADIAARIAGRDDFADILLAAEAGCPDLAGGLIGATASIPEGSPPDSNTGGPTIQSVLPVAPPTNTATIPAAQPTPPAPTPTPPTVVAQPPVETPPPPPPPPQEPPPDEPPPDEEETNPVEETNPLGEQILDTAGAVNEALN